MVLQHGMSCFMESGSDIVPRVILLPGSPVRLVMYPVEQEPLRDGFAFIYRVSDGFLHKCLDFRIVCPRSVHLQAQCPGSSFGNLILQVLLLQNMKKEAETFFHIRRRERNPGAESPDDRIVQSF